MESTDRIRAGELSRKLDVPYRDVRYVLERGFLPEGAETSPGHGNHRLLDRRQAFWLALVLLLKRAALPVPRAAKVARFALDAADLFARQRGHDPRLPPFDAEIETGRRWSVEVGDQAVIRVTAASDPRVVPDPVDRGRQFVEFDWAALDTGADARHADPAIILRIDLTRVARLLRG